MPTHDQLRAIFDRLQQLDRLFCIQLYETDLGLIECTGLMRENFNSETGRQHITRDLYRQPVDALKSESNRPTTLLPLFMVEALRFADDPG